MICDLHTHSRYSFDGSAPVDDLCRAARKRNVNILAITDHCDMLPGPEGYLSYLAGEADRIGDIENARPQYPELELLYGVEIGNAVNMPEETRTFLTNRKFDFVIGAVHFLPDGSDIYQLPYENEEAIGNMFLQYFRTMQELVELGGFDSLAHLDYPLRVLKGKLHENSIGQYRELVEPILAGLVRQQIALEVNTRGTYDWQGRVGPEDWVLTRYRELGGRYVTIGSDAHSSDWVGAGFSEAAAALCRTGFSEFTIYRSRTPVQMPLPV